MAFGKKKKAELENMLRKDMPSSSTGNLNTEADEVDQFSEFKDAENFELSTMGENIQVEDDKVKKGGAHAKEEMPAYMQKSRRMRKILIVVIILLVVLLVAGAILIFQLVQTAKTAATQQTQQQTIDVTSMSGDSAKDASSASKKTTVPDLVSLLGLNTDEAIEALAHGAQVTSSVEVNEEGNPIKSEVRVALTAEPSDSKSGTPTVYLSLNEEGLIIQSGYSAATSALGYGSLSFTDAIENEQIIENTLEEAGLTVEAGTITLPADKMAYSTYASDGTTLTKENCSFEGTGISIEGTEYEWTGILSYDYTTANATGNLVDTIRTVFVYVS